MLYKRKIVIFQYFYMIIRIIYDEPCVKISSNFKKLKELYLNKDNSNFKGL